MAITTTTTNVRSKKMVAPTLPPMMAADVSAVLEDISGGDAEGVAEFSYILTAKVDDYTCRYLL